MSKRNDILNTLKEEMEDYIKSSRGYKSDLVEVVRGIQMFEDIEMKPVVAFWCYRDESTGQFAGRDDRFLYVYIYGYCDTDGYGDVDDIHNLAADVEYFLYNDFSYTDDTFVGDFTIYEGGVQDPASMFELDIKIKYSNTTTSR